MRLLRRVVSVLLVFAAFGAVAAVPASALTRSGAEEWSIYWANRDFYASAWAVSHCTGPYENVKGHTQWACYGFNMNGGCQEWQINVGPYGEQTYHRGLYCETKRTTGAESAAG